ncbi:hypothetical protein BDR07DRAFT_1382639 [Suillus spraguei]|nr:hypothetical protein BDR07DRAFT_1382639 [Suillus spraguei]
MGPPAVIGNNIPPGPSVINEDISTMGPCNFLKRSIPPLALSSQLLDEFNQAFLDGAKQFAVLGTYLLVQLRPCCCLQGKMVDGVSLVGTTLGWNMVLRGPAAFLQTSYLADFLASTPMKGHFVDAMVNGISHQIQLDSQLRKSTDVEELTFASTLHYDLKRWSQYMFDRGFTRLRQLGDSLSNGELEYIIFPININGAHWTVFLVNAKVERYAMVILWTGHGQKHMLIAFSNGYHSTKLSRNTRKGSMTETTSMHIVLVQKRTCEASNLASSTITQTNILTPYPNVIKTIVHQIQTLRQVGVALSTAHCWGIIVGILHHKLPNIFSTAAKDGSMFKCSDSWVKAFLYDHLQYTICQGTCAAQKLPPNVDNVCRQQFLQLSLTIHDNVIPYPEFLVNIDQTNVVYQPTKGCTYERIGSKQVAIVGQEEKFHRSVAFQTWLDINYEWIHYRFVPAGTTGVAQPCDVGIQCPLKLAIKKLQHEDIVMETLTQLKPEHSMIDLCAGLSRHTSSSTSPTLYKKGQAFSLCKAGTTPFNLSFKSLASVEARWVLHDLPKTDPEMWQKGDADTNLDEDHVANVDEQPGDEAPLSLLLEFIASGKDHVPDGYITDANGSLRIDTAADMFEEVVVTGEPEVFKRGKQRCLANKQYDAYEQH